MTKKQSILLVEDERELALMMSSLLESNGFSALACFGGEEALFNYKPEETDLLITDLRMPGMSGFELIVKILELNPGQMILVMSGMRPDADLESVKLTTLNFIPKPFSASRLLDVVQTILEARRLEDFFSRIMVRKDLITICSLNGSSFVFEFSSRGDKGCIYLQKGILVHAETRSKRGREAFYEILSWENGGFCVVPLEKDFTEFTINESLETLLGDMSPI